MAPSSLEVAALKWSSAPWAAVTRAGTMRATGSPAGAPGRRRDAEDIGTEARRTDLDGLGEGAIAAAGEEVDVLAVVVGGDDVLEAVAV